MDFIWRVQNVHKHRFLSLQVIELQKAKKNRCLTGNYIAVERGGVSNSVAKCGRSSRTIYLGSVGIYLVFVQGWAYCILCK